jgi:PilZ domain-containing protein
MWGVNPLSTSDAVSLLFGGGGADLEISAGAHVHVDLVRIDGDRVVATAPRLSVASGMRLTGRLTGPDGRPWELVLTIEDASYNSPDLALIRLQGAYVQVDETRRSAVRMPMGGVAWLEAVTCKDVADGTRVDGTLDDISITGVSFATRRTLHVGDRLVFHGRFFADELHNAVEVASLRPSAAPGHVTVGCRFTDVDRETAQRISRILTGGRPQGEREVDMSALRSQVDTTDSGGWRRRFRRASDPS